MLFFYWGVALRWVNSAFQAGASAQASSLTVGTVKGGMVHERRLGSGICPRKAPKAPKESITLHTVARLLRQTGSGTRFIPVINTGYRLPDKLQKFNFVKK